MVSNTTGMLGAEMRAFMTVLFAAFTGVGPSTEPTAHCVGLRSASTRDATTRQNPTTRGSARGAAMGRAPAAARAFGRSPDPPEDEEGEQLDTATAPAISTSRERIALHRGGVKVVATRRNAKASGNTRP